MGWPGGAWVRHVPGIRPVADQIVVVVDRLVLLEAITNIVDSAIKYGPRGSAIDVRVRAEGDSAVLDIADQGAGIPSEHRERICDRFFRLDHGRSRDSGGTGLGLAIAKWAVEVNGGGITVEEALNGGSVFRITLPVAAATSTWEDQAHAH